MPNTKKQQYLLIFVVVIVFTRFLYFYIKFLEKTPPIQYQIDYCPDYFILLYSLFRPIRHTSYPATFSDDSTSPVASSDLDYNSPLSSFEGGSDTFENPATKFKNFFVDHNSNGFKRPSRSPLPSTLSSVQPLYNEQSTTLAFEPSYDQLRPSSIRPISRHG